MFGELKKVDTGDKFQLYYTLLIAVPWRLVEQPNLTTLK
jgi:hypothetical protein